MVGYKSKVWLQLTVLLGVLLQGCAIIQATGTPTFKLQEINGRILVNRGSTYFTASEDTELEPGDSVITMTTAEAMLVFGLLDVQGEPVGDECVLRLPADSQITIQGRDDCEREDAIVLNNTVSSQPDVDTEAADNSVDNGSAEEEIIILSGTVNNDLDSAESVADPSAQQATAKATADSASPATELARGTSQGDVSVAPYK